MGNSWSELNCQLDKEANRMRTRVKCSSGVNCWYPMLIPSFFFSLTFAFFPETFGKNFNAAFKTKVYSMIDMTNLWFNSFCAPEGILDLSEKCCNSDLCMISMQSTKAKFRQVVRSTPLASKDMC